MKPQIKSELPTQKVNVPQPHVLTDEQLDKVAGGATAIEYGLIAALIAVAA